MKVTVSALASALMVMMSSLLAHLRSLDTWLRFMPMERAQSQRKCLKSSDRRRRATWLESMAWREKPRVEQSRLASDTRSLMFGAEGDGESRGGDFREIELRAAEIELRARAEIELSAKAKSYP
ncbi:hypothetical protein MRB53_012412 [Persea americana]|uniref:Uncharacterized protein n=1 Tax=Persea americana TaxID=3435 RepID=A0ACC2LXL4_PERAE|nr:hypothetical protein MRB53_012412 [Persea americana]